MTAILVVDDDTEIHHFVRRAIPQEIEVVYVGTVQECLNSLDKTPYDLVLLDLRLPGIVNGDGFYQLREQYPSIPILIITELHSVPYVSSLIHHGAIFAWFKPDKSMEEFTEIAERQLSETVIFSIANWKSRQEQLISLSANAAAIEELKREVRELRTDRHKLAIIETRREVDEQDIQALQREVDLLRGYLASRAIEREKGKWGIVARIVGVIGAAITALLGSWAAGRWGKP